MVVGEDVGYEFDVRCEFVCFVDVGEVVILCVVEGMIVLGLLFFVWCDVMICNVDDFCVMCVIVVVEEIVFGVDVYVGGWNWNVSVLV